MDSYTERLELPDGQWAVLLTRLPYERALAVRKTYAHDPTDIVFVDAVMRAMLWEASLKHGLTGEPLDVEDVGAAATEIVDAIADKALELYAKWRVDAYPNPKGKRIRSPAK